MAALAEVVTGEIAKAITASLAGAGIKGAGKLSQLLRTKIAHRATDDAMTSTVPTLDEWNAFVVRCAQEDPEFFRQLADAVADVDPLVPDPEVRPAFVPPDPFCDRDDLRGGLPEYGVFGYAGPPGSGKTALVQRLAADYQDRFPLHHRVSVDLNDFRAGDIPRLADAKRHVLRQLGIEDIVADGPGFANQYRSALSTRRLLLVVENILGADEFDALIEPWPKALVLATTRRLTGDLQLCIPHWIELPGLEWDGAREMLAVWSSRSVVAAELDVADQLLERFDRRPSAIKLLGRLLSRRAHQPNPVAGLMNQLEEMGIERTDRMLGAVMSGQLAEVTSEMRESFRLLALHPGGQFTAETAKELLGRSADGVVDELRELGLVEAAARGRYRMSWAVRRFAVELGMPEGGPAAMERLLKYFAARAVAADLAGGRRMRYYRMLQVRPWPDNETPIEWLAAEAEVLVELVEYAYLHGYDDEVGQLCGGFEVLSLHHGQYGLCLTVFERGVQAAQRRGELRLLARQHALCGRMATLLHHFDHARSALDRAREIADRVADLALTASIWEFTGRLAEEESGSAATPDWRPAIAAYVRALEIDRRRDGARRARGLHARMLANALVKAGLFEGVDALLREALDCADGPRNASRVFTVWARYAVALGNSSDARRNIGEAYALVQTAGAAQYRIELDDLMGEIEYLENNIQGARELWATIAQYYVAQGHPRSKEFFAKLNRPPLGL
ncbi:NB-ARC domain-containing protein [Nocardia macrotermitis]|uniref:AAA+ ATPase domain-containing protein n=1 Tax=Nocardia macrotermitis TaxID=2585198 RepID=A0A7K0CYH7_9NOCA|nr:NB-ARC domain-containing protein [Nocardia macrotermitis]MQY18540.1 hypothetical protein [Nocardia macrotermitis]